MFINTSSKTWISVAVVFLAISLHGCPASFHSTKIDESSFLISYLLSPCKKVVALKTINNFVADGNPGEFKPEHLILTDKSADSSGPAGSDLLELYLASDGNNLMVMSKTDGAMAATSLLFGINNFNFAIHSALTWDAYLSPATGCQGRSDQIASNGSGIIELAIPLSCFGVQTPYVVEGAPGQRKWKTTDGATNIYDSGAVGFCLEIY